MAPLELEGPTLGQKHHHYNRLVVEAIRSKEPLKPIEPEDGDIKNLIKIDVACKNKDVKYILEVLKSEDQLYVSKAIKRSPWLITDSQYADIINPEYLYTKLYPQMTTKAFNKFLLNIRLHLKDEKRVECFYNYIKKKDAKSAYKWLQYCSLSYVENEVSISKRNIPYKLLLRLLKKSFSIYELHVRSFGYYYFHNEPKFLAKRYPEEILNFLESLKSGFHYRFGQKETKVLMKKCPNLVLQKFGLFAKCLNLATFGKLLKKIQDIEEFLLQHAKNKELLWLFAYDKIQHFLNQMPDEKKFTLVKEVFITREALEENHKYHNIAECVEENLCNRSLKKVQVFMWYKFASFEIAFTDLIKLIRAESKPVTRNAILQVLLFCAKDNKHHINTILQYYHDKHINEPFKFKIQFVNSFLSKVQTHTLDDHTWDTLIKLFHSMEVFIDSDNNVQSCIKAIIIRSAIRQNEVPEIIKNKFEFVTFKTEQTSLRKQEEKDALFMYLRNFITAKINSLNLTVEAEFNKAVTWCQHLLNLLKDWGKDLHEYSYALHKVKELIRIEKVTHWGGDINRLYNTKKSWRKEMFEESIFIMPTEKVYLNILKHDPGLLLPNIEQIMAISINDNVSLRHFLRKIRIYWPHTFAEDWKRMYFEFLEDDEDSDCDDHKSAVDGLSILLSHTEINDLLRKYAPTERKIDWNRPDQFELSLCKQIGKNIHRARPQPSVEDLLLYAKGDYLQFIIPSLNAVFSQLSTNKSHRYIPILLDGQISLQKVGIRCAIRKLPFEELKELLSKIWNSTKKSSIRTVLFTHIFQILCQEKSCSDITDTWTILCMLIENLTCNDNKLIFNKLSEVYRLPESIQPQFYMKSYTLLSSLPAKCNCKKIIMNLQYRASDYLEHFDIEFFVQILSKNFENLLIKDSYRFGDDCLISSFILASVDEETQIEKYEKTLDIVLDQYLPQWEKIYKDEYRVKKLFENIFIDLSNNMCVKAFEKNWQIPVKVFERILIKLESEFSYYKYYVLLTTIKLVATFAKLLNESKVVLNKSKRNTDVPLSDEEKYEIYTAVHEVIAPLFTKVCTQYLKEDIARFGTSIYSLFSKALINLTHNYAQNMFEFDHRLLYIKYLLDCGYDRDHYMMVHDILMSETKNYPYGYGKPEEHQKLIEIYKLLIVNCPEEIKMQFHEAFTKIPGSNDIS